MGSHDMTITLYATKIEPIDLETTVVSVVIDSDLGRLVLDVAAETADGNPGTILQQVRERLARFGNELLNSAGKSNALRLSMPPQSK
jgi:hypothetical protein